MLRLVLVLAFVALAPLPSSAQNRLSDGAEIDAYLGHAIGTTKIPGIVAMVADSDGILYSGAFGNRDVANKTPMTVDTIFRIASMTKPVTSAAVMMLVQQGDVSLEDPIADYLPAFESPEVFVDFNFADKTYTKRPATTAITIRHLLTHTSGLGYTFDSKILAALVPQGASVTPYPLLHDPGTKWT